MDMKMLKSTLPILALAAGVAMSLPLQASAQSMMKKGQSTMTTKASNRANVRGTIESFNDTSIVVKTREGPNATVTLSDGWVTSRRAISSG